MLGVSEFGIGFMATSAVYLVMGSFEGEIGHFMVEGVFIQQDNDRITPLMVSMAMVAFRLFNIFFFAVKAFAPVNISIDLFMAVAAQFRLAGFAKGKVTTFAFLFVFCVPTDQHIGHDKTFDPASGGIRKV